MPKIIGYTPAWLSERPGHDIFSGTQDTLRGGLPSTLKSVGEGKSNATKPGPKRTIARRGTEVFVAVGKEIRWADLVHLKEDWEDNQASRPKGKKSVRDEDTEENLSGYRVRKLLQLGGNRLLTFD
jgi:nucleoporin NUP82